jgi:NAD(P)-dependent dehydrogenase (short-subunit alcohol dehydrogenase family)
MPPRRSSLTARLANCTNWRGRYGRSTGREPQQRRGDTACFFRLGVGIGIIFLEMESLVGRTAVVTGAASGIGLGMCRRFSREGMNVVMADIEVDRLTAAAASLGGQSNSKVLAVPTDVSDAAQVDQLAAKAAQAFGAVHVLCNNAGVLLPNRPLWQNDLDDWNWLMGVNLWGVVHGIRTFLPDMIDAGEEGHVVNTASAAGLAPFPGIGPYCAAKHAVTALTEVLDQDLRQAGSRIHVSVLCPGPVASDIADAARNRPGWKPRMADVDALQTSAANLATGMHPDHVGDLVFEAIREQRFYIFTDESTRGRGRQRAEAIRSDVAPSKWERPQPLTGRAP